VYYEEIYCDGWFSVRTAESYSWKYNAAARIGMPVRKTPQHALPV